MCSFNLLANCIILVCLPMIFAGPLDQVSSNTIDPGKDDPASNKDPASNDVTTSNYDDLNSVHLPSNENCCPCTRTYTALPMRDDYVFSPEIGMHKFHAKPVEWNEAREICNEEGGHLAVINSRAEANVLMEIYNQSQQMEGATDPDVTFIGMHDMYKEGVWVTILGDKLVKAGFAEWSDEWGGQPDNGEGTDGGQNCGGLMMKDGTLDDVYCDSRYPFFCELPRISVAIVV